MRRDPSAHGARADHGDFFDLHGISFVYEDGG
jgi:hypothetical protein